MRKNIKSKFLKYPRKKLSKKAVSEIISYVLLIVMVLGISAAVYKWMSTSTPSISETCPEDVSLYVENYNCTNGTGECASGNCLIITMKNNGNFNIDGFFIRASNNTSLLPTAGLVYNDFDDSLTQDSFKETGQFYFHMINQRPKEPMKPGEKLTLIFDYQNAIPLKKIQIEPFLMGENSLQICNDIAINLEVDNSKHCYL
jgi:hypothetical protein